MFSPPLDLALGELFSQSEGVRALLIGVAKRAHPIKLSLAHKFAELLKLARRFSGKANDERRSQRNPRNRASHFLKRANKQIRSATPFHPLQHRRGCMLQRHVNIGTNLFMARNSFEQSPRNLVGISVEKPDPAQIFNARQLFEQEGEPIFQAKIFSVASGVLPDELDLAHARMR